MHVDRLKFYSQRQFALKMTTRYCFTKVSEGYTEKKAMHYAFTDTKHAEKNGSLLKHILLSIPSLLSFLNSLHCSCVFCSSSNCCTFGMFCHSYRVLGCLYTAKYMKGLIHFKQNNFILQILK